MTARCSPPHAARDGRRGPVFANPIGQPASALEARDAGTFAPRWTWNPPLPGVTFLRPAVVDGIVWEVAATVDAGLVLGALDGATGAERWTGFLPGTVRTRR